MRSAVDERGSSCRNTSRSRHSGSSFSIPITVTSTSGSVVHMRPLPSDSTTATVPVSAIPKFAPEIAIGTDRNFSRRCRRAASAIPFASHPRSWPWAIVRSNRRRISARFLWIAGTRMCDERSPASWMINSARSVSIAEIPSASSALLSSISSVAIDLTLMTSRAPWPCAIPATIAFASAPSRAQWTMPPARVTDASSRSSCSGSVAIVRALIAEPAARSASQSSSSAIVLSRLARIVVVALPRLRRSWASCSVSWAAAGNLIPAPPGSPRGAPRARRSAACAARRRCASGTSCRPTCRPPRACRARCAACPRASPSRCRRS